MQYKNRELACVILLQVMLDVNAGMFNIHSFSHNLVEIGHSAGELKVRFLLASRDRMRNGGGPEAAEAGRSRAYG
jgi:hypothetical protein